MADRFLRHAEVTQITTLGSTEIERRMKKGEFPKAVKLGPKTNAWLESEVNAWKQALIDQRGNTDGKTD